MNRYISRYLFYYPATLLFGENIPYYLRKYEKFQYESYGYIRRYQERKIKKIIGHAYKHSPFYRRIYDSHGVSPGDFRQLSDLCKFPIISKRDIVDNYKDIILDKRCVTCVRKTTGGSLGLPVTILKGRKGLAKERAATWLGYKWAGIDICDPQGRLWGQAISRAGKINSFLTDLVANRIRLSAFNISDEKLCQYLKSLYSFKPVYLYGYASVIVEFIRFLDKYNSKLPNSVKSIITTSEVLSQKDKAYIESVTGVRVYNEYGCGEVGSIAHECEEGLLHLMEMNHYLEVDNSRNYGSALVTDFNNTSMPLIRYDLGDVLDISYQDCHCGRSFRVIKKISGRAYDFILTSTGCKIHPEKMLYIFEELKNEGFIFDQFQVEQVEIGLIEIRLKALTNKTEMERSKSALIDKLKLKFGEDFTYRVSFVREIEREPSGKLRVVKGMS